MDGSASWRTEEVRGPSIEDPGQAHQRSDRQVRTALEALHILDRDAQPFGQLVLCEGLLDPQFCYSTANVSKNLIRRLGTHPPSHSGGSRQTKTNL